VHEPSLERTRRWRGQVSISSPCHMHISLFFAISCVVFHALGGCIQALDRLSFTVFLANPQLGKVHASNRRFDQQSGHDDCRERPAQPCDTSRRLQRAMRRSKRNHCHKRHHLARLQGFTCCPTVSCLACFDACRCLRRCFFIAASILTPGQ